MHGHLAVDTISFIMATSSEDLTFLGKASLTKELTFFALTVSILAKE